MSHRIKTVEWFDQPVKVITVCWSPFYRRSFWLN